VVLGGGGGGGGEEDVIEGWRSSRTLVEGCAIGSKRGEEKRFCLSPHHHHVDNHFPQHPHEYCQGVKLT